MKVFVSGILLKVNLILLFSLIYPIQIFAEAVEEASFKLYINQDGIRYIPVLLMPNQIFINFDEFLKILEYPLELDFENKELKTCYPNKGTCFSIENNLFHSESITQEFPKKMFLWNEASLYVDIEFIKRISPFPIKLAINSLSITIVAKKAEDIPYLKWATIKKKYDRQGKVQNIKIDTLPIKFFRLNTLGYSISGYGAQFSNTRSLTLNSTGLINGELFGGQFNVQYSHIQTNYASIPDIYTFNWTLPNLNSKILKQFVVFRTNSNLIMPSPFFTTGIMLSNIPNIGAEYRNYQLKGKTTPNTQIEVYCNGQMVKTIESDSEGNYQTEVPVGGGENKISTIIYDEYGNSYSENQVYYLPPNLEARRKFSYKASGGVTDNRDPYYQFLSSYGLTNRITLSAGSEAVWFNREELKRLDIFAIKTQLFRFAPIDVTYIPNFRWSVNGNINPINGLNTFFAYEKYDPNQTVIYSLRENYNVGMSGRVPLIGVNNNFFISFQANKYENFTFFNSSLNFTINYRKIWSGISVVSNSKEKVKLENIVYGWRNGCNFTKNFNAESFIEFSPETKLYRLRGRMQYHRTNKYTFFAESNWDSWQQDYNVSLGVYYNFPYFGFRSIATKGKTFSSANLNVLGSINFREKSSPTLSQNMTLGNNILIIPFLDLNGNGKYDKKEPIITDIKITSNVSGQIIRRRKGISIINITPNRVFQMRIPKQTLSNMSWQIKSEEYSIYMYSYQTHTIHIPIQIFSELSGIVSNGKNKKLNRVKITITNLENRNTYTTYTDEWGEYFYSTLTAGRYMVSVDQKNGDSDPKLERIIEVPVSDEGTEIENINFILDSM